MLWVDKHRPHRLDELTCHRNLTAMLKSLTSTHDLPHMLFYGPSGAGKKTRIMAVLRELFGDGIDKFKAETISPEGTSVEFVTVSSSYHNEISAPELGFRDRVCVQSMIKQLSSQVGAASFAFGAKNIPKFRVFVISEADALSAEAQAGLRRTLEKYVRNARVILHCNQLSSMLTPLRSRCLAIRVPLPTVEEVVDVLQRVAVREQLEVSREYLRKLALDSKRNTRMALLAFENMAIRGFPTFDDLDTRPWVERCREISQKVLTDQSPKSLLELREVEYDLLTSCIPGAAILKTVCLDLLSRCPDAIKPEIARAAAHYSVAMKMGSKDIWHIEAFLAQCMNFIKRYKTQSIRAPA